jgi:hypothetical protein
MSQKYVLEINCYCKTLDSDRANGIGERDKSERM